MEPCSTKIDAEREQPTPVPAAIKNFAPIVVRLKPFTHWGWTENGDHNTIGLCEAAVHSLFWVSREDSIEAHFTDEPPCEDSVEVRLVWGGHWYWGIGHKGGDPEGPLDPEASHYLEGLFPRGVVHGYLTIYTLEEVDEEE